MENDASGWKPRRTRRTELEQLFDGVPDHLQVALWRWVGRELKGSRPYAGLDSDRLAELSVAARIPVEASSAGLGYLKRRCFADEDLMLEVVDTLLELDFNQDAPRRESLDRLLVLGSSIYRVSPDGLGLEVRMSDTAREQAEAVLATAAEAPAEHLKRAWNAGYKRRPAPTSSYSESIKAVESAYAPLVSPGNKKQTLGTMIRDISAKPSKWQCILGPDGAPAEPVLGMMRALWQGQLSRHGVAGAAPEESVAKARAGLQLAVVLVQLATESGFGPVE